MGEKIGLQNLVNKYQSDKGSKDLTTWSQFIVMLFCLLTGADSLREISGGLYASLGKAQSHRRNRGMSLYPELRQQQVAL